jgi:hypothetical protein
VLSIKGEDRRAVLYPEILAAQAEQMVDAKIAEQTHEYCLRRAVALVLGSEGFEVRAV